MLLFASLQVGNGDPERSGGSSREAELQATLVPVCLQNPGGLSGGGCLSVPEAQQVTVSGDLSSPGPGVKKAI